MGSSKTKIVANLSAPVKENSLLTVDKRAPRTSAIIPKRMTSSKSLIPTQPAKPDLPNAGNDEQVQDQVDELQEYEGHHNHLLRTAMERALRPKMPPFELLRKDDGVYKQEYEISN